MNSFREGTGDAFLPIVRQVMRPPIDGFSLLDPEVYKVSAPAVSASTPDDASRRQRELYRRFPELRPGWTNETDGKSAESELE